MPPSSSPSNNDDSTSPFDIVSIENSQCVVILFGWLGASSRHVNKYAQIYNDRGCSTVSGVADTVAIMATNKQVLRSFALEAARHAAQLLRQQTEKDIPLCIHAFSNGGAFVLEQFELAIQEKVNEDVNLCGERLLRGAEIFDSSPAYMSPTAGLKAIGSAVPSLPLRLFVWIVFVAYMACNLTVTTITRQPTRADEFWAHLENTTGIASHQVYLYSPHDDITDHSKLEELIEHRKQIGTKVTVEMFPKSGHVQHLRTYPQQYVRVIHHTLDGRVKQLK